ncbi:MAG: MBL fold metallo-hydrolase [Treponema sp.]|jgi:L-ascorbate metabolism protein UlaG (beta-lactamase superfamily)|nr:MBL fold metallo-hydrolase [Treponema sp.]
MEKQSRWYKRGPALLAEIEKSRPAPGTAEIWYLGQHGFAVSLGGQIFYIDVILNDLQNDEGASIREYPPPFAPGEVRRLDYVLCTHNHIDHLNLETLIPLAASCPTARFVVPRPWRHILIDGGIAEDRVLGVRDNEEIPLGPTVKLLPVIATHTRFIQDEPERLAGGESGDNGKGDSLCLGYIIKGDGLSIYHAGDTWVTPALVQGLKAAGPLDIAILPINGTDWERTDSNCVGNMGALDAVKLARAIPVDLAIPAHYDMVAYNRENPALFADYMYQHCPEKRFHVFALGERFIYQP